MQATLPLSSPNLRVWEEDRPQQAGNEQRPRSRREEEPDGRLGQHEEKGLGGFSGPQRKSESRSSRSQRNTRGLPRDTESTDSPISTAPMSMATPPSTPQTCGRPLEASTTWGPRVSSPGWVFWSSCWPSESTSSSLLPSWEPKFRGDSLREEKELINILSI